MELSDLLQKALQLELDGKDFYLRAARLAPNAAEMFERLAADEDQHYATLQRIVQAPASLEDLPVSSAVLPLDVADPIFPRGVSPLEVLPPEPTVNDALIFGMSSEMKSVRLYREAARQAEPGSAVYRLLVQLINAEVGHFNTLMQRYEALNPYPA